MTPPSSGRPVAGFAPTVHVVSAAPAVPAPPDLSVEGVLKRWPGLAAARAFCWTGSVASGWGNLLSDLDLFAFSDTAIDLPVDESAETWTSEDQAGTTWTNWMGRYGDVLADVKVGRTDTVERILKPFLDGREPEFCGIGHVGEDVIFRMSVAVPLKDQQFFDDVKEMIYGSSYQRALARSLKATAENLLVDIFGQVQAGDAASARHAATMLAATTADQCLVLAGDLCRGPKWLMRRLADTPSCGIDIEEYRTVVVAGAQEGESDAQYALRVTRWAQYHLVRTEGEALRRA